MNHLKYFEHIEKFSYRKKVLISIIFCVWQTTTKQFKNIIKNRFVLIKYKINIMQVINYCIIVYYKHN